MNVYHMERFKVSVASETKQLFVHFTIKRSLLAYLEEVSLSPFDTLHYNFPGGHNNGPQFLKTPFWACKLKGNETRMSKYILKQWQTSAYNFLFYL